MSIGSSRASPIAIIARSSLASDSDEDLQQSVELLRAVAKDRLSVAPVVRTYTPRPTLALSRRESRMPGFGDACQAARMKGFTPVVRPTGGRAAAYDETCLVFDLVTRDDGGGTSSASFERVGRVVVDLLRSYGVDARLGPVAGEYCPGQFSVNARGAVKMVGTSQRVVRGARLVSGVLAFGATDELVGVLDEANRALQLDWNPSTFGSMRSEAPAVSRAGVEVDLIAALLDAFTSRGPIADPTHDPSVQRRPE